MKKLPVPVKWAMIIIIILAIAATLIFLVTSYGSQSENQETANEQNTIVKTFENVTSIDIRLQKTDLQIKKGDQVKVEYPETLENLKIEQNEGTLNIIDESITLGENEDRQAVIVYLPEDKKIDNLNLELQNINANIEKLDITNLKLNMDTNTCKIEEMTSDTIEFNNQGGSITINQGEVKAMNMHSENGHDKLNLKIAENASMTLNTSSTELNLMGNEEDYQVNTSTENGSMYVQMGRMDSNGQQTIGNGNSKINIEAENAALYINFKEN